MEVTLITQNSKLKKTSEKFGVRVFNFGIPAYKSVSGKVTCPFAKDCIKYCYAQKGAYIWSNVSPAFEKRYHLTKLPVVFKRMMSSALKRHKVDFLRIHDSGDFYSLKYVQMWLEIIRAHPDIKFYAYTKSVLFFQGYELPENFDVIFSEGGKLDNSWSKETARHSAIFDSVEALNSAGYVNASEYDLYATKWFSDNHKVGLVFH